MNELERRTEEFQGSVLKIGCTNIPSRKRGQWVKLKKAVALVSVLNLQGVGSKGTVVHAVEINLGHDYVRLQESPAVWGLSFNFELAS